MSWQPGYNYLSSDLSNLSFAPTNSLGSVTANGLANIGGTGATTQQGGVMNWLGDNASGLQTGLGTLNSLASLWGAFQANKLAKDQFDFTKSVTNTNLNNSIQSYNTSLEDRINARAKTQGMTSQEVSDYLAKNSLTRG